jgi:hypothetical protein
MGFLKAETLMKCLKFLLKENHTKRKYYKYQFVQQKNSSVLNCFFINPIIVLAKSNHNN